MNTQIRAYTGMRGDTIRAVVWTLVVVAALVALLGRFLPWQEWIGMEADPYAESTSEDHPTADRPANQTGKTKLGYPVTFDSSSKTGAEILAETLIPWLEKNWAIDSTPAGSSRRQLVGALIDRRAERPNALSAAEISELAEKLTDTAGDSPLDAYLVGMALGAAHPEKLELLTLGRDGLSRQKGAEILAYLAAVEWANAFADVAEEDTAGEEDPLAICLATLKDALDKHEGFSQLHDRVAGFVLVEESRDGLLSADPEGFFKVVKECDTVKPWLKKWIEGKQFHKIAWAARGGGYWNSVPESGRALFPRNIQKALNSMKAASDMSPQHPGVAADLIGISMAHYSDKEGVGEMLKWFEKMTTVQIDYAAGYENMLWGLRPRWRGKFDSMEHFGELCAKSGRYDSNAPWWYLQALQDASTEWDLPSAKFPKFKNSKLMIQVFEGAEAEPKREPWRRHDRTAAAAALASCWKYDEAKKWVDLVGEGKMDPGVLAQWGMSEDWLREKVELFTGPHAEMLRDAEEAVLRFRGEAGFNGYDSVLAAAENLHPAMRQHLEHERKVARIEFELKEKSEVADFGPDDTGAGWLLESASAKDGTVIAGGVGGQFFRATCEAKVGLTFKIEGRVEMKNADAGVRAWISFGYPEWSNKERWSAVSFAKSKEGGAALLSNAMNTPEEVSEMDLPDAFDFRLKVNSSGVSLWIDDELIWDQVPLPRNVVKEGHGRVGVGGIFGGPNVGVQFSNLRLSKN